MKVGEQIRQLRKSKGLTLKRLSDMVGISVSFLSDIENDRSKPSLERLQSLALCLGTSVALLMDETSPHAQLPASDPQNDGSDFVANIGSPSLRALWTELKDFDCWSENDKAELLQYLRAKRIVRSTKKSTNV